MSLGRTDSILKQLAADQPSFSLSPKNTIQILLELLLFFNYVLRLGNTM